VLAAGALRVDCKGPVSPRPRPTAARGGDRRPRRQTAGLGEAQDRERARLAGMAAHPERHHLHRDVLQPRTHALNHGAGGPASTGPSSPLHAHVTNTHPTHQALQSRVRAYARPAHSRNSPAPLPTSRLRPPGSTGARALPSPEPRSSPVAGAGPRAASPLGELAGTPTRSRPQARRPPHSRPRPCPPGPAPRPRPALPEGLSSRGCGAGGGRPIRGPWRCVCGRRRRLPGPTGGRRTCGGVRRG
jgi:hypothetical protein